MKVALITILDNTNFGTYLQALALGRTIEALGYKVEVIKYIRFILTPKGRFVTQMRERGLLRGLFISLKGLRNLIRLRKKNYDFINSFLSVTKEYNSNEELQAEPPIADIYLTGSDQVWNSIYNHGIDKSYYLDFAPKGYKRVSYAASIGMDKFPESELEVTKSLLSKYDVVTVREKQNVDLLHSIGINSQVVLDPTLLLDKQQWQKVAKNYSMHNYESYLLIYSVETKRQEALIKYYAKAIAKAKGLKIYEVSYSSKIRHMNFADRSFLSATPDQFLNLMFHASFVIISSFHGTAFSINFNKQFLTVSPDRFNNRVDNILGLTGLSDRMVIDYSLNIHLLKNINYELVNEKLKIKRQESLHILKKMLS